MSKMKSHSKSISVKKSEVPVLHKPNFDQAASEKIVQFLSILLADTYVLYTKTQKFHWNVIDERFYQLHKLWEEQYQELAEANDELAERIRMLQAPAPGSLKEFLSLTSLKESTTIPNGNAMLQELMTDHETIIQELHIGIILSTDHGDEGTADLLIQRLRAHEKMAWFLRSHLINA